VIDTESGEELGKLEGHKAAVQSLVFVPHPHPTPHCQPLLASSSLDGTLRVWGVESVVSKAKPLFDLTIVGTPLALTSIAQSSFREQSQGPFVSAATPSRTPSLDLNYSLTTTTSISTIAAKTTAAHTSTPTPHALPTPPHKLTSQHSTSSSSSMPPSGLVSHGSGPQVIDSLEDWNRHPRIRTPEATCSGYIRSASQISAQNIIAAGQLAQRLESSGVDILPASHRSISPTLSYDDTLGRRVSND
jgi:hypothetical protein